MLATFVHVPRTGGTTIAAALGYGPRETQHKPLWAYERPFRPWTIVRNPFARLVSLCAFVHREQLDTEQRMLKVTEFCLWLTTGRFDARGRRPILYPNSEYPMHVWAPMIEYLAPYGPHLVSTFRFETLVENWDKICIQTGVKPRPYPSWDEHNVSRHFDFRSYYNSATRKLVLGMYAADFAVFEYPTTLE